MSDHDFDVVIERMDFGRDLYMYVQVDGEDQWLVPTDGGFIVQPKREAFMKWNPALLDAKELVLSMYKAIIVAESGRAALIDKRLYDAFQEAIEGV